MLNANGPGFQGLYAGDSVEFFTSHHKIARASVLPLLVFADHVQVKFTPCGYTVNADNFIRLVRRGKRHIEADRANVASVLEHQRESRALEQTDKLVTLAPSTSYAAEVIADSSGKYCGNGLRFATKKEAEAYAMELSSRWMAVREWRVVESTDRVNYRWQDGAAVRIPEDRS